MIRPSAAAYVCRPHVACARASSRAAWPAVSSIPSSLSGEGKGRAAWPAVSPISSPLRGKGKGEGPIRKSPDCNIRRSRLAASPPATHSQKAISARPGRVIATGIPGPIVTGHSWRCAFSQISAVCSDMGQAISTWSSASPAAAMRRNTSSISASRPPAQNIVSVSSLGVAPTGLIKSASRSAFEAGAGATVSIGEARVAIRRGRSRPGSSKARGVTRAPGRASRRRRSSGVQMMVGSSIRRSAGWIGQTSR